jgi:hypothetical protein
MEADGPIIAIIGSARAGIVGTYEQQARTACTALGQELAKAGFRLAVYSSDPSFIEADIVSGFVAAGASGSRSVLCYHPQDVRAAFAEMEYPDQRDLFYTQVDPNNDWEVSFYHSLAKVDGVLLLGGGNSTLIAGHIALSRRLPIIAIAEFGGQAKTVWAHLAKAKPEGMEDEDIQAMAVWSADSAKQCIQALQRQLHRITQSRLERERSYDVIREKADKWDSYSAQECEDSRKLARTGTLLSAFIVLFLGGLLAPLHTSTINSYYIIVVILGLLAAGGMGASVRLLLPDAPTPHKWRGPILGLDHDVGHPIPFRPTPRRVIMD